MSSNGKAKLRRTEVDLIKDFKRDRKKQFGLDRRNFAGVQSQVQLLGSAGRRADQKDRDNKRNLRTEGDTMLGPIAFNPVDLQVADSGGTKYIDIGIDSNDYSTNVIVLGFGGGASDLDEIRNAQFAGQLLILQAVATTPITLKHGTSNIRIPGGSDYTISGQENVLLKFDSATNEWVVIANFNDLGSSNLDMNGNDIIMDADGDSKIIGSTDDTLEFDTGGFKRLEINNSEIQVQGGVNLDVNGNNVILDVDGDTYITNNGDDIIEFFTGGFERIQIDNSEVQLQGGVDLDMNGNDIILDADGDTEIAANGDDAFNIVFGGIVTHQVSSSTWLFEQTLNMNGNNIILDSDGDSMITNDGTDDVVEIDTGGIERLEINNQGLKLGSADLNMNNNDILNADLIQHDATHSITLTASQIKFLVSGAGDTLNIDDGTGSRIQYEYDNDDFSPNDNIANLGKSGRRWVEVFATIGSINTSFSEYKKNIKQLDDTKCLEIAKEITPIKFKWKDSMFRNAKESKKNEYLNKEFIGYKADAFRTRMPEAVTGDDGVYQNALIAVLLGSVRKLSEEIDRLKSN